ncbi:MAG: hypothetical protein M1144_02515 [Candidatus Thermoplasmatota archaeon]|jgi:hypothetical protein|nr:hypothetical protein [Candidatus Thermoplasmatota archaeon]
MFPSHALFISEGPSGPKAPGGVATPPKASLAEQLVRAGDLNEVFRIVRVAVKSELGLERAGLSLALANLPPTIGAYWQLTGNVIVMNDTVYEGVRGVASSREEANAFAFVVLMHEYLHSLGYWDEQQVRRVTHRVALATFPPDHRVSQLAGGDLWEFYPFLRMLPGGRGDRLRFVNRFASDVTDAYIR